jgi:hypothetical protein
MPDDVAGAVALSAIWRPQVFQIRMGLEPDVLEAARCELVQRAARDTDQCCGYFPALAGRQGILDELPACKRFAAAYPEIELNGFTLRFSFMRLSLRRQASAPAYHLDTDAATAVTGDPATLEERLVRRALVNFSASQERVVHYLDLDASTTTLTVESSYAHLGDENVRQGRERRIAIPRRVGDIVHGVNFVANRVLHSGVDGHTGHFVAAYGRDCSASEWQPRDR